MLPLFMPSLFQFSRLHYVGANRAPMPHCGRLKWSWSREKRVVMGKNWKKLHVGDWRNTPVTKRNSLFHWILLVGLKLLTWKSYFKLWFVCFQQISMKFIIFLFLFVCIYNEIFCIAKMNLFFLRFICIM